MWRKDKKVIHSGKLIHFVPQDGVYVYFRYDSTGKVMVILNKNIKEQSLDLKRFREVLANNMKGTDVISGREFVLENKIFLSPLTPLILELTPP